jgi:hypothetical protein
MFEGTEHSSNVDQILIQIADLKVKLEDVLSHKLPYKERMLLLEYVRTRLDQLIASARKATQGLGMQEDDNRRARARRQILPSPGT